MEKKISLAKHIASLIDLENESNLEENVHTQIISYTKFCKELKIKERDIEGDKIYKELYKKNTNLKSLFSKVRTKEKLFTEMIDIYNYQYNFFKHKFLDENEETYIEQLAEKYKASEAMIVKELFIFNNMIGEVANGKLQPDPFLSEIDEKWRFFLHNYSQFLKIILDPIFYDHQLDKWEKVIRIEKEYYLGIKQNKISLLDKVADCNPYKNLYLYSRNRYMKNFYVEDLPDEKFFSKIKKFDYCIKKEEYSLKEIAVVYRSMLGVRDDDIENQKVYERMKKVFQGKRYMERFKKNGIYIISQCDLSTVLSAYMFFQKKSNREDDYTLIELDQIIRDEYATILDILVKKKNDSKILIGDFMNFYRVEFRDIFQTLSNDYQDTMIEYLLGSTERIYTSYLLKDEKEIRSRVYSF